MSALSYLLMLPMWQMKRLPGLMAKRLTGRHLPLIAPDFPLVLVFTEEAGSASLTKWFLFHAGKLDEAARLHPSVDRYRTTVLYRQPGYRWQVLRQFVLHNKPVVKLVRNPYDRAVSGFLSALHSAHRRADKNWGSDLVAAARIFAGKPAADTPALSFRDFVRFLAANSTERGQIDDHVARQHVRGERRRIDRVIKMERFAEEVRQIESEYNLTPSPPDLITNIRQYRAAGKDHLAAPAWGPDLEVTSKQVRRGSLPACEALYDDETRRLVRACFAADFEAYGYE